MNTVNILFALSLLSTAASWAQSSGTNEIRTRPVIGYANFHSSHFIGDTGATPTRLKTEDVVVGFAVSSSRSWRDWRGEVEYAWRYRTDMNGYLQFNDRELRIRSNVENQTLALNLYRYFRTDESIRTYAIAGFGLARNASQAEMSDGLDPPIIEELSSAELHLMWNAGFGAILNISGQWSVDLGYRYVFLGQASTPRFSNGLALSTGDLSSHDIAITVTRDFGLR